MVRHLFLLAVSLLVSSTAFATELGSVLGALQWGDTPERVLDVERERVLEDYRIRIAGLNDPLEIDRIRRQSDEQVEGLRASLEPFDGARTGYEVSVIAGEIRPGAEQSMMTIRDGVTTRYLVFSTGRLSKYMVVYDQASLDYVGFEGFIERLGQLFGPPGSSDFEANDIGVRRLVRALWTDGQTRLRVVDRSGMFASYLLVYSDATLADDVHDVTATVRANRPSGGRNIGDMVRRLETEGAGSSGEQEDVVDRITGREIVVDTTRGLVPTTAASDEDSDAPRTTALDDDEDLETIERQVRPSRSGSTRRNESSTTSDSDDDGLTIY
jgi:hypothetical protein